MSFKRLFEYAKGLHCPDCGRKGVYFLKDANGANCACRHCNNQFLYVTDVEFSTCMAKGQDGYGNRIPYDAEKIWNTWRRKRGFVRRYGE